MRLRSDLGFLAAALLAAPLAACATVGPDFERPDVTAPEGYVAGGGPVAAGVVYRDRTHGVGWWEALNAPKLDALIEAGLTANPSIAEADAALDAARASVADAYGRALPSADGRAGAERARVNPASFGFTGFPGRTFTRYTLGALVSYDLDLYGRERRTREAAEARLEMEGYHAEAARLALAGNIALQVAELAVLSEQIATNEAIVDDDRETRALVMREISAGSATDIDRVRAESQLAQDEAALPALRQRAAASRHALALLVGQAPGAWAAPDFALTDFRPPEDIPIAIPSSLVRGRPDILAAESELHSAMAEIGVAETHLYPNVSLSADFSQIALHPEDMFNYASSAWSIGPQVSIPLFHGGRARARVEEAEADARAADARYRATVLRAFGEVADALEGLSNAREEVRLQRVAVGLAEDNVQLGRRAYEIGSGDLPDVLDAQRQLSAARRAEAAALGRQIQAVIRLYASTATTQTRTLDGE